VEPLTPTCSEVLEPYDVETLAGFVQVSATLVSVDAPVLTAPAGSGSTQIVAMRAAARKALTTTAVGRIVRG
jgi:type IV secretory pathway VirJ component